jgi:hypothetical protein
MGPAKGGLLERATGIPISRMRILFRSCLNYILSCVVHHSCVMVLSLGRGEVGILYVAGHRSSNNNNKGLGGSSCVYHNQ